MRKDLFGAKLEYRLSGEKEQSSLNEKNYNTVKDALEAVGVKLSLSEDVLRIEIDPVRYESEKTRRAGRRNVKASFTTNSVMPSGLRARYSDVIFMLQSMNDIAVMKELGMARATYYRHKKAMLSSGYYKALDKARLDDIDYLKSPENDWFDEDF